MIGFCRRLATIPDVCCLNNAFWPIDRHWPNCPFLVPRRNYQLSLAAIMGVTPMHMKLECSNTKIESHAFSLSRGSDSGEMVTKAGWDRKGRSGFGDISVLGDKHIWPWWPDTRETFSGHFCLKSEHLSWRTGETIQHFSECEKVMEIPVVMFSVHKLAISNKGLVSRQHHHDLWHCLGGLSLWQTTSHWWFPSSQTTSCSDHSSNEKQLFFH